MARDLHSRLPDLLFHSAALLFLVFRRVSRTYLLTGWSADDFDSFTWGSTRIVVGEGKSKKVISNDEEVFDESVIPMKKFSGAYSAWTVLQSDG